MEPNIEVFKEIMKSKSLAELDHDEDAEDEETIRCHSYLLIALD